MNEFRTQRVRDPVHGLIRFDEQQPIDRLAWHLINSDAFQRLRRIKQLGFSEYVFPGATHTRFAHCIGVFATARKLVTIVERETDEKNDRRAAVAVLAALLHDIGHGPFSHTFEEVQKSRGVKKNHEQWSADIIKSQSSGIPEVLQSAFAVENFGKGLETEIADLLEAETPSDIYHAIVSSSFDADRLDYLQRDRMMTGSGAGAIDFDWLMDNVRIAEFFVGADEDENTSLSVPTFVFHPKSLQAAESFLLARYHLYEQVYLHKTTRGMEHLLGGCLRRIAEKVKEGRWADVGLEERHPLIDFLGSAEPSVDQYLLLDDFTIWGALEQVAHCSDEYAQNMAIRILTRQISKCLDVASFCRRKNKDLLESSIKLKHFAKEKIGVSIFHDAPKLSIYGKVGADDVKLHKRLSIDFGEGVRKEIVDTSQVVNQLAEAKPLARYYFLDEADREAAIDFVLS